MKIHELYDLISSNCDFDYPISITDTGWMSHFEVSPDKRYFIEVRKLRQAQTICFIPTRVDGNYPYPQLVLEALDEAARNARFKKNVHMAIYNDNGNDLRVYLTDGNSIQAAGMNVFEVWGGLVTDDSPVWNPSPEYMGTF